MDATGRHRSLKRRSSRITAWIEIDGAEQRVLEEGAHLLRVITEDLEGARLRTLRLEYDPASAPGCVAERGAHALDVLAPGVNSPEEAALWRLVLRVGAEVGAESASTSGCAHVG